MSPWFSVEFGLVAVDAGPDGVCLAVADTRGLDGVAVVRAATGGPVDIAVADAEAIRRAQEQLYGKRIQPRRRPFARRIFRSTTTGGARRATGVNIRAARGTLRDATDGQRRSNR